MSALRERLAATAPPRHPLPMTQSEALELAQAKWGVKAFAVHYPGGEVLLGAQGIEYVVADTWRQACERAGLVRRERDD